VAEAFATWRAECAHAQTVVASFSDLDEMGRDATRPGCPSVRWVLVHMIEESAPPAPSRVLPLLRLQPPGCYRKQHGKTAFKIPIPLQTSAVQKSVAMRMSLWIRINSLQVVVFFRPGAGGIPWRFKMFPTLWSLMR
jgi:hypothetical protein